jgi:hypothetical protein
VLLQREFDVINNNLFKNAKIRPSTIKIYKVMDGQGTIRKKLSLIGFDTQFVCHPKFDTRNTNSFDLGFSLIFFPFFS